MGQFWTENHKQPVKHVANRQLLIRQKNRRNRVIFAICRCSRDVIPLPGRRIAANIFGLMTGALSGKILLSA